MEWPQCLCLVRARGTPSRADQERVDVRDLGREFEAADPLHQAARVGEAFCRRRREPGQVRDEVEMMQGPFQHVGVEVVGRGEDLPLVAIGCLPSASAAARPAAAPTSSR